MHIFQNLRGKLELYDSLDTILILTFWDITRDRNFYLLDKNYSEKKKYNKKETELCESTWLELFDKYYSLRESNETKSNIVKSFDEFKLREKINQINNNIDFLLTLKKQVGFIEQDQVLKYEQECYSNLSKIDRRIKPKYFDGIDANVVNLGKVLKSFINQYNVAFKQKEKVIKKEIQNVYDVVACAESWLNRTLDVETMVASRWIAYEKQIEEKQKAAKKNGK